MATSEADDSDGSVGSANPPCYSRVLLEDHVARAEAHPGLYPLQLATAIADLAESGGLAPAPHPHRTYHVLADRKFCDGEGTYYGELDHKLRRSGYGHMVFAGGDLYHGEWERNARHGQGAYFWARTGSVFAGRWKCGERRGPGAFVFGRGRAEGVVVEGVWDGKGLAQAAGAMAFVDECGQIARAAVDARKARQKKRSEHSVTASESELAQAVLAWPK
jgi:hypothetical protein